jgi:hypothetical protein
MSEITIRLRVVGAEESVRQLGRVGEQLRQLGRGLPETVRQMGKLGDTATAVGGAIAAFVATFRRLSGLRIASEDRGNYVTNSKCLLGDAEKARALTEAFYQLGAARRGSIQTRWRRSARRCLLQASMRSGSQATCKRCWI